MHACFASPEAMRFWNTPSIDETVQTARSVSIRFVVDRRPIIGFGRWPIRATDRCLGMVNYHDGHIRNRRVAIGYIVDPARRRQGVGAEAVSAMLEYCFGELGLHRVQAFIHPDNIRLARWSRSSDSVAKVCFGTICGWATIGATTCSTRCSPTSDSEANAETERSPARYAEFTPGTGRTGRCDSHNIYYGTRIERSWGMRRFPSSGSVPQTGPASRPSSGLFRLARFGRGFHLVEAPGSHVVDVTVDGHICGTSGCSRMRRTSWTTLNSWFLIVCHLMKWPAA